MARPSKSVLTLEGHRTKKEIAIRKEAESGTLSGESLKERPDVKADDAAHAEFVRLKRLFKAIEKDDAIYSETINDYCLLHSRRLNIATLLNEVDEDIRYLSDRKAEIDPDEYIDARVKLYARRDKLQAQELTIMDKQRAIEDKNLMNIQSALRSVPKKPEERKSPLLEALNG